MLCSSGMARGGPQVRADGCLVDFKCTISEGFPQCEGSDMLCSSGMARGGPQVRADGCLVDFKCTISEGFPQCEGSDMLCSSGMARFSLEMDRKFVQILAGAI
jgi:hypothetical protein